MRMPIYVCVLWFICKCRIVTGMIICMSLLCVITISGLFYLELKVESHEYLPYIAVTHKPSDCVIIKGLYCLVNKRVKASFTVCCRIFSELFIINHII